MEQIKKSWKAIIAFVGVFGGVLVGRWTSGQAIFPTNGGEWAGQLGSAAVVAVGVYLKGNKQDEGQVKAAVVKLEPESQMAVAKTALDELPTGSAQSVADMYRAV